MAKMQDEIPDPHIHLLLLLLLCLQLDGII